MRICPAQLRQYSPTCDSLSLDTMMIQSHKEKKKTSYLPTLRFVISGNSYRRRTYFSVKGWMQLRFQHFALIVVAHSRWNSTYLGPEGQFQPVKILPLPDRWERTRVYKQPTKVCSCCFRILKQVALVEILEKLWLSVINSTQLLQSYLALGSNDVSADKMMSLFCMI